MEENNPSNKATCFVDFLFYRVFLPLMKQRGNRDSCPYSWSVFRSLLRTRKVMPKLLPTTSVACKKKEMERLLFKHPKPGGCHLLRPAEVSSQQIVQRSAGVKVVERRPGFELPSQLIKVWEEV
jgi:uncharacterized Zn-finger protein